jgi:hypothetical protein
VKSNAHNAKGEAMRQQPFRGDYGLEQDGEAMYLDPPEVVGHSVVTGDPNAWLIVNAWGTGADLLIVWGD